ncbi:SBBP repeat-containing protein [Hymenobacter sp. BT683]|uniref:SBBP repeat-containing protein n=1 Tax=Hymenobacter jeongseonensis TaxID=2791027 RepID=A0ABS0IN67_9BACT|nr:SBBP repeat-containing protein [Hymenobacter jeongseonensis]MBF9239820.1 SBBP repeat-containing protein [Hymenobacter jeongseonensis]
MKQPLTPALLLAGSLLLAWTAYAQPRAATRTSPPLANPATPWHGDVRPAPYQGQQTARPSPAAPLVPRPAGSSTARAAAAPLRATAGAEPVTPEWVARYNLPVPPRTASYELARDVAVDGAGNVFVTGLAAGSGSPNAQLLTVKYAPTGQPLWAAYYTGLEAVSPYGIAVGVDAAGNAYVVANGLGAGGNALVKYAPTGQQLWDAHYPGLDGHGANFYALHVDAAGNAYLTGDAQGPRPAGDYDYLTVKYAPTGHLLWDARYNSPDNQGDYAQALALDAAGNVYVTGISYRDGTASSGEFATVKYAPTGQQRWVARYNSPGEAYDEGRVLAVDPAGNAYVSGYSFVEGDDASTGYVTVKYAPSGQPLWTARGEAYPRATAVDAAGNVFVTGSYAFGTASPRGFITAKYAADGQELWTVRYNGPGDGTDVAQDLAVDAAGNAYVTGSSDGGPGTAADYATVKYAPTGQPLWAARYNGPAGSGNDNAAALALDPAGNVYVTGDSQGADFSSGVDFSTIKYSQSAVSEPPACNPTAHQPVAAADRLRVDAGALTFAPAQLLANDSDPLGRPLQVAHVGPTSAGTLVRNADGTFTYTAWPGFVGPATFTYLVQAAGPVLAFPGTGHYYEFVPAPGVCWAAAKAAAAARRYQGLAGYLATVTGEGEKNFLVGRAHGPYWFGASDAGTEGEWRWQTGPEAGQGVGRGGTTGSGAAYAHWLPGQPDDYSNPWRPGEDYGQLYGNSGLWNDVDACNSGGTTAGYVVEYGGLEACVPLLYALGTVTLDVSTSPPAQRAATRSAAPAAAGPALLLASPNPSTGQFRVQVVANRTEPVQLDLFDVQGRRVRALFTGLLPAGELREVPVDAQVLSAGIYLLRLQSGPQVQQLRVSIQK